MTRLHDGDDCGGLCPGRAARWAEKWHRGGVPGAGWSKIQLMQHLNGPSYPLVQQLPPREWEQPPSLSCLASWEAKIITFLPSFTYLSLRNFGRKQFFGY